MQSCRARQTCWHCWASSSHVLCLTRDTMMMVLSSPWKLSMVANLTAPLRAVVVLCCLQCSCASGSAHKSINCSQGSRLCSSDTYIRVPRMQGPFAVGSKDSGHDSHSPQEWLPAYDSASSLRGAPDASFCRHAQSPDIDSYGLSLQVQRRCSIPAARLRPVSPSCRVMTRIYVPLHIAQHAPHQHLLSTIWEMHNHCSSHHIEYLHLQMQQSVISGRCGDDTPEVRLTCRASSWSLALSSSLQTENLLTSRRS